MAKNHCTLKFNQDIIAEFDFSSTMQWAKHIRKFGKQCLPEQYEKISTNYIHGGESGGGSIGTLAGDLEALKVWEADRIKEGKPIE